MKSRIISLIFLILSFVFQVCTATSVSSEKDGIVLEVTITPAGGKHLVSCRLTNNSPFPICSSSLAYKHVFYAKLTDAKGDELLPDMEWAANFGQKSSPGYKRQKITSVFQVNPEESLDWEFFLEEAYSATNLDQSHELQVSWESIYGGTKTDRDGNPYHFPPDWKTSISIPLAEHGIGSSAIQARQSTDATGFTNKARNGKGESKANNKYGHFHSLLVAGVLILVALLLLVGFKKNRRA